MATKKEYTELQKRAMLAKQRLKMGYWQTLKDERERIMLSHDNSAAAALEISDLQKEQLRRQALYVTDAETIRYEESLYQKVCAILDADEETVSPIGQLIDREAYALLDEAARQKYVLELSKKFRELSERYYRERKMS